MFVRLRKRSFTPEKVLRGNRYGRRTAVKTLMTAVGVNSVGIWSLTLNVGTIQRQKSRHITVIQQITFLRTPM